MGLIARILKTEIGNDNETVQTVEAHYGENKYCDQYAPSGDDCPPLPDDRVACVDVEGTGNFVGVGVLNKSQGAKPGEKLIYSRDEDGKVTAIIHLKNDGSVLIDTKKPVTIEGQKVVMNGGGAAASRVGDTVQVTIPPQTVVVGVSGGSGAPAVGTMNVMGITLTGIITSGSETVEIG